MTSSGSKVVVAGASGLVGQAALRHFAAQPGWDVVGLSRRPPLDPGPAAWRQVDLLDRIACREAIADIGGVTHVVYAAVQEAPGLTSGWLDRDLMERNAEMLSNVMNPVFSAGMLRHISLLQGTKAYGMHHPDVGWGRVRNPFREREPRSPHPNFYFLQEDYLRDRQDQHAFGLTIFRPTVVYGGSVGANMNPLPVIGAWAALLKAEGEPLHFPGPRMSSTVKEAVDADLVARALGWAADHPESSTGTFNVTNGDVFVWPNVWPVIAEAMEMQPGGSRPTYLADWMPTQHARWASIVDRHHLRAPAELTEFVGYNSLVYTDLLLNGQDPPDGPHLNSTIAIRQAGFGDCLDTEDMFHSWIRRLRSDRLLP